MTPAMSICTRVYENAAAKMTRIFLDHRKPEDEEHMFLQNVSNNVPNVSNNVPNVSNNVPNDMASYPRTRPFIKSDKMFIARAASRVLQLHLQANNTVHCIATLQLHLQTNNTVHCIATLKLCLQTNNTVQFVFYE
jgi:hypothetical protein